MRTSEVLVLHADRVPISGVDRPGPHQIFRDPHIEIEERELGPLPPGAVRVEMLLAGICGTDLHAVQSDSATDYVLGSSPLEVGPRGRILGHEGVGRVVEVGEGVTHIRSGAVVTFESIIHCQVCNPCRRGDFNQCERAELLGMERDGLFASVADVPAVLCHDVTDLTKRPEGLDSAVCIEPASCAYVACSACRVTPGTTSVVFGAGPIGIFAAMLCRLAFGAGIVSVVEPTNIRRELASRWANRTYDVEEFFANPPADSIDVVIEASGEVENVDRIFRMLNPNGRIALLGRSGKPLRLHAVDHLITNNISISGSRGNLGGAFSQVLRLVRLGRLPLHEAITVKVDGLDELKKFLEHSSLVPEENCKVVAELGRI